ncbi:hypothetical protein [Rhizobium sp. 007]|uniref:hypothetical protein n=1 Tax=Rhizobium sp. 007 TaxID=2785056 RepID=UPI001FEE1D6D|nr:hypothetical protein [Rhizobium sp. 007]
MCGIAGWIDFAGLPSNADQLVETMNNVLARRGPDEAVSGDRNSPVLAIADFP